ncbi:MAG: 4,5-DOPA-extradiol-dioxygenase [Candidatus Cryosericum sp.]
MTDNRTDSVIVGESTGRMPALFLAHGSPMNIIEHNAFTEALAAIQRSVPAPKGIVVLSAHWEAYDTRVTSAEHPRTIYDFGGFPRELYRITYPCPGSPRLAQQIQEMLDLPPEARDRERGLDHGAWSVLHHMYPTASIPVVQVSLDVSLTGAQRMEMGRRLLPLRDQGILVIGSGNVVHNLRLIDFEDEAARPYPWAEAFDSWVASCLASGRLDDLAKYETMAPSAELAVPTNEHYIPLLYIAGLRQPDEPIRTVFEGFQNASLSMRCIRVG